jgi:hypothetical protein
VSPPAFLMKHPSQGDPPISSTAACIAHTCPKMSAAHKIGRVRGADVSERRWEALCRIHFSFSSLSSQAPR